MDSNDQEVCAHVVVSGRVQGVAFRAYTREQARKLGLVGWVRNLADGRVELRAQGTQESVEALIAWCHKGSPFARVQGVDAAWEETSSEWLEFEIVPGR